MAVALTVFIVVAAGVTFALTRALTEIRGGGEARDASIALGLALEHATTQPYANLADSSWTRRDACGDDITQSCIVLNGVTYRITYTVSSVTDPILTGGGVSSNNYLRVTATDTGTSQTRSSVIPPPTPGYQAGYGNLRVRYGPLAEEAAPATPFYLLDTTNAAVGNSPVSFGPDGVAFVQVPNGSCTPAAPCHLGVATGETWWRTGGGDPASEWSVFGADSGTSGGIVVGDDSTTDTSLTLFQGGNITLRLLAEDSNTKALVPASDENTICLWVQQIAADTQDPVPVCNDTNAGALTLSEYSVSGNMYLYPPYTTLRLWVDHPDGVCPAIDGLLGSTQWGWDTRAVCSTWTWGYPTGFGLELSGALTPVDTYLDLSVTPAQTVTYDLVWRGDDARPAAGYAGENQWMRPREAPGCSLDSTCTPIGLGGAPEATECPGAHCYSVANATPHGIDPGPQAVTAGVPLVVQVGGSDPDGDPITVRITSAPDFGTLSYNEFPIGAGTQILTAAPSGTVVALLYETSGGDSGTASFTFEVEDPSGAISAPVQVNLIIDRTPVTIDGTAVSAAQSATNVPIDVTVRDGFGDPYIGATVTFSAPAGITLQSTSAVSGAGGVAEVLADIGVTTTPGSYTITATTPGLVGSVDVTVVPVLSGLTVDGGSANQGSTGTVTVHALDLGLSGVGGVVITPQAVPGAVFTRSGIGFEQGSLAVNDTPRYRDLAGRRGIHIEEGTTNLATLNQAGVETNLVGIVPYYDTVLTRDTTVSWEGVASVKVDTTTVDGDGHARHGMIVNPGATATLTSGTTIVCQARVKMPVGVSFDVSLRPSKADGSYLTEGRGLNTYVGTGDWQYVVCDPYTPSVAFKPGMQITVKSPVVFWVDGIQMEAGTYQTTWQRGASTRATENLTIPADGLNAAEGTIDIRAWVDETIRTGNKDRWLFSTGDTTSGSIPNRLGVYRTAAGSWVGVFSNAAGTLTSVSVPDSLSEGWHLFTLRWGASGDSLAIDGTVVGSSPTGTHPDTLAAPITLGGFHDNTSGLANTYLAEVRVQTIEESDAAVRSYAGSQFLADDANTIRHERFNGSAIPLTGLSAGSSCTTDASGACDLTLAASTSVGAGVWPLTVTSGAYSGVGAVAVNSVVGSITAPASISLSQNESYPFTVTITDLSGGSAENTAVTYSETSNAISLATSLVDTSGDGTATNTVLAAIGAAPGSATVNVYAGSLHAAVPVTISAAATYTDHPSSVTTELAGTAGLFAVTVYDGQSNVVSGTDVTVSTTTTGIGVGPADGDPQTQTLTTDGSGTVTFSISADAGAGTGVHAQALTVSVAGVTDTTADVQVIPVVASITLDADPYTTGQGLSGMPITTTALDAGLSPVPYAYMTVDSVPTGFSVTPMAATATAGGQITFSVDVIGNVTSGDYTVTFGSGSASVDATVHVNSRVASLGGVTDPVAVPRGGHSRARVYAYDLAGDPMSGVPVTFTIAGGAEFSLTPYLSDAPYGWWKLDETSGTSAVDATSSAQTGTYVGPVTFGVAGPGGTGTAVDFAGGTSRMDTPIDAAATFVGSHTIQAWFKTFPGSGYARVLWGNGASLKAEVLADEILQITQGTTTWLTGVALPAGAWHLLTVAYDAPSTTMTVFIDGVEAGTHTAAGFAGPLGVGTLSFAGDGASGYVGSVDEAVVFPGAFDANRALSYYLSDTQTDPLVAIAVSNNAGQADLEATAGTYVVGPSATVTATASGAPFASFDLQVDAAATLLEVEPGTVITNHGFETGDTTGWSGVTSVDTTSPVGVPQLTYLARRHVTAGTAGWESISSNSPIALTSGQRIGVSGRIYVSDPSLWVNIRVRLLDGAGANLSGTDWILATDGASGSAFQGGGHSRDTAFVPSEYWQTFELISPVGARADAAYAAIDVFTEDDAVTGEFYLDDVRFWDPDAAPISAAAGGATVVWVDVLDANQVPIVGEEVTFATTIPGATWSNPTVTTDADGRAMNTLNIAGGTAPATYSGQVTITHTRSGLVATPAVEVLP